MVLITEGNVFISIAPKQQEGGPLSSAGPFDSNCQTPQQTVEIIKSVMINPKTKRKSL